MVKWAGLAFLLGLAPFAQAAPAESYPDRPTRPISWGRSSNSNNTKPNEAKQYRDRRRRRRPHRHAAGAARRQAPFGAVPGDLGPRPGARRDIGRTGGGRSPQRQQRGGY